MVKVITLLDVEYVSFRLAKELMAFNEPIPDFGTRYPGKLEGCLVVPFQQFENKDLYPDLISKASILFYLMVKDHPFFNGNKRIALTTMLVFLYLNNYWFDVNINDEKMYKFAIGVAKSKPGDKDETLKDIQNFIRTHSGKVH